MTRCNPFGYATDAGPRHLMGGMYGPEYAGRQVLLPSGTRGPGVCPRQAEAEYRAVMVCEFGHKGPVMDLCRTCWGTIQGRMADCCTRCVWPDEARALNEEINRLLPELQRAADRADTATTGRLQARVEDLGRQMDELRDRGIIRKVPMRLVEVS